MKGLELDLEDETTPYNIQNSNGGYDIYGEDDEK